MRRYGHLGSIRGVATFGMSGAECVLVRSRVWIFVFIVYHRVVSYFRVLSDECTWNVGLSVR